MTEKKVQPSWVVQKVCSAPLRLELGGHQLGQNSQNRQDEEASHEVPEGASASAKPGADGGGIGSGPNGCTLVDTLRKKTPKSRPRESQMESAQRGS